MSRARVTDFLSRTSQVASMTHEIPLVLNVAVALAIAVAGGFAASWLRQSPILGYLLAGVLIGPFTPGFVGNREQIAVLADVGVIFLMFGLGVAFSLKDLARVRAIATFGTIMQVMLTIVGGVLAGLAAGLGLHAGHVLRRRARGQQLHGDSQDAARSRRDCLRPRPAAAVDVHRAGPDRRGADRGAAEADVAAGRAAAAGSGDRRRRSPCSRRLCSSACRWQSACALVPWIMGHVTRMRSSELFIVTAAVLALGAASVSTLLGLSPALGAFVAGLLLSESEFDHRVIAEVVPVRDLFATLFFVSVGMLIDVRFIVDHWPHGAGGGGVHAGAQARSPLSSACCRSASRHAPRHSRRWA